MDEETKVEKQPDSIQLDEVTCLRLTAAQLALEKAKLQLQLIAKQLQELQAMGANSQQLLRELQQKYEELRRQTAATLGVSSLDDYQIDLNTGAGIRRPPPRG